MESIGCLYVSDLALEPVVPVPAELTLRQAALLLASTGIALIVDTEPFTELTERDVVRAIGLGLSGDASVTQATHAPEVVGIDTTCDDAARALIADGRPSVLVVHDGCPVGLLTLNSVIGALAGGVPWVAALRLALRVDDVR